MTARQPAVPAPAAELEPIERASADELRALQLQRLRWTLAHAYENVPHTRAKFDRAGVHPRDLRSLEDLADGRRPDRTSRACAARFHTRARASSASAAIATRAAHRR